MIRNRPVINTVVGFLALIAFIFLILCTVSAPITNSIYLFRASTSANSIDSWVQFGVFGGCGTTSNIRSGGNLPVRAVRCTPTELSYEILSSQQYQQSNGWYSSRPIVVVDHNTTSALALNPIAAGLAALAMILAPIAALLRGRVVHGMTTIAVGLATLATWGAFGINTAVIVKARSGAIDSLMGVSLGLASFNFKWGAVMPLSLVAAVLLSVALVLSALSFFLGDQKPHDNYAYGTSAKQEMGRGSFGSY